MTTLQVQARALGDPTRHAIFRYVGAADRPVGVGELTAHFSFNHNAIRQHLAKLVEAGLVVESKAQAKGPGRPPLVYVVDPSVGGSWGTVSPYERLSRLLLEMVQTGLDPRDVGRRAADQFRVSAPSGEVMSDLRAAMAQQGFEPEVRAARGGTEIVLHHCPFEAIARLDRDVVCGLHLGIAEGLADATDGVVDELVAYDPRHAGCRLRVRPRTATATPAPGRLTLRARAKRS